MATETAADGGILAAPQHEKGIDEMKGHMPKVGQYSPAALWMFHMVDMDSFGDGWRDSDISDGRGKMTTTASTDPFTLPASSGILGALTGYMNDRCMGTSDALFGWRVLALVDEASTETTKDSLQSKLQQ